MGSVGAKSPDRLNRVLSARQATPQEDGVVLSYNSYDRIQNTALLAKWKISERRLNCVQVSCGFMLVFACVFEGALSSIPILRELRV